MATDSVNDYLLELAFAAMKQAAVVPDPAAAGGMPPGMPPGAPPMDPSMMGGGMPPGMPPMDPSMMGGGMPPGMPPMDPSMMGGGMPPGGGGASPTDPSMLGISPDIANAMGMAPPPPAEEPAAAGKGQGPGQKPRRKPEEVLLQISHQMTAMQRQISAIADHLQVSVPASELSVPDLSEQEAELETMQQQEDAAAVATQPPPQAATPAPAKQASVTQQLQALEYRLRSLS